MNQRLVTVDAIAVQVCQLAPPLADQLQEATPGVEIVLVQLQMFRQPGYTCSEQSDLGLGRTGVSLVGLMLLQDGYFLLFR